MRSSLIWAVLAILVSAVAGRAEDSYTIKIKHVPDVGKTVSVTDNETRTTQNKVTDPDGKVLGDDKKHTIKTDVVYTETTLEKGDKAANKYKRTYEKATRTVDDNKPTARSYEGRTLVFEKKGDKYTVTAEGDKAIDDKDLAELTAGANQSTRAQEEAFLPSSAVKVGETWKMDGKKLADAFPGGATQLDVEHTSGEGKLTKVYEKDGHRYGVVTATLKLAIQLPKGVEAEKPPIMELKLTIDTAIDGSSTAAVMTANGSLTAKGTAEQGGKKFTFENNVEESGKTVRSAEK